MPCINFKIRPAQLSCLGGSAGRASAHVQYTVCRGIESRLRQLISAGISSPLTNRVAIHTYTSSH